MKKAVPTLYLFNNVFYPQTIIPLTVSDKISKDMLIDCFTQDINIALYHLHSRSKGIGTLGKILIIDYNSDGSLAVIVQGLDRIKLLKMEVEAPFPIYQIDDYFDIDEKPPTLQHFPLERLHAVLEHWLERHVQSMKERNKFMNEISSPSKLINNLCLFMIKDIDLKLIFLESTSLLDRVRMMNALLIGETPEAEDIEISEAIKSFERLESDRYKNVS